MEVTARPTRVRRKVLIEGPWRQERPEPIERLRQREEGERYAKAARLRKTGGSGATDLE